jgi:hypothetical protein
MKLKHNKLRNPAILFELLVRQITTDTLNNRESKSVDILKRHYNNTQIAKEFKIYKTLYEAKNLSEAKASILINSAIQAHSKLNKTTLRKAKYDLIADIKENYSLEEFFKSKVNNYKTLASIYMLFEAVNSDITDPEVESKYRFTIMESICDNPNKNIKDTLLEEYNSYDKGTRALVYKLLIQKFNEKYSDLDDNQKSLLKEYITNISTSDSLREYVNTEITKVKKGIKNQAASLKDEARKVKLNEVCNFIEEIPENKQVCEKDIHNLLYYYELLKEFKSIKA